MRAAAIGTYRALEMRQTPEHAALIAQVEREGAAFPLLGLDESSIGKFIETAWEFSANGLLVRRLHDMTEGNPFFLNEVLRQMAAEGQLASDASNVPTRLTIPRGVIEFIRGLIHPLAEDARNVLDFASVIGRDFALSILAAASETPRERLIELLDEAASLELIHEVRGAAGQRLADTREVITIAERAGERDFALEARFYRIADLLEAGDIVAADVEQREYLTAEAELRDRFKRGLLLQGMRALLMGASTSPRPWRSRPSQPASRAVVRSRSTRFSSSMVLRCGSATVMANSSRR